MISIFQRLSSKQHICIHTVIVVIVVVFFVVVAAGIAAAIAAVAAAVVVFATAAATVADITVLLLSPPPPLSPPPQPLSSLPPSSLLPPYHRQHCRHHHFCCNRHCHCRRRLHCCHNIAVSIATTAATTSAVATAANATVDVTPSSLVKFFSTPLLCHPLHTHIVAPCVIGHSLASHRMPLLLPSPVDCCLSILSVDEESGAIICPFYSMDLSNSPLMSLEKCVAGAAELRPLRRLSLCSRAANFGHPLCQAHVQLERHAGGVGGQACLCLA